MRRVSLQELSAHPEPFDRLVLGTPEIDHFCSSTLWTVPAHQAFHAHREPFVWQGETAAIALARATEPQGRYYYLEPLEASWLLACPLLGEDPEEVVDELGRRLEAVAPVAFLSGMVRGGALYRALHKRLSVRYRLQEGPQTVRHAASLEGGLEGFLSRRSAQFRSRLRRTRKKAERERFVLVDVDEGDPEQLYERILAVEERSWKGRREVGITTGSMCEFYRLMVARLVPGRLRLSFVQRDGQDVAYVLGGVLGKTYRGLQFSFDEEYRDFALGNVAQLHTIERLSREGVELYDLGSDIAYKRRWGEGGLVTTTVVAVTKW